MSIEAGGGDCFLETAAAVAPGQGAAETVVLVEPSISPSVKQEWWTSMQSYRSGCFAYILSNANSVPFLSRKHRGSWAWKGP